METGRIKSMTTNGNILESRKQLEADIIVPATGLKLTMGDSVCGNWRAVKLFCGSLED